MLNTWNSTLKKWNICPQNRNLSSNKWESIQSAITLYANTLHKLLVKNIREGAILAKLYGLIGFCQTKKGKIIIPGKGNSIKEVDMVKLHGTFT